MGIALIISGHGAHLILLRSNAVKWHAFHSIHSQLCRNHFERRILAGGFLSKPLTMRPTGDRLPDRLHRQNAVSGRSGVSTQIAGFGRCT